MPQALHGQPERERKPEALPFHGPQTKTRSQRVTAIFMPPLVYSSRSRPAQPQSLLVSPLKQALKHLCAYLFKPLERESLQELRQPHRQPSCILKDEESKSCF